MRRLGFAILFLIVCAACTEETAPTDGTTGDLTTVSDSTILIRSYTFLPDELEATPGQTLTIYNLDSVVHQIVSETAPDAFDDSGDFESGVIDSNDFGFITMPADAEPGDVFYFYCALLTDKLVTPNGTITIVEE